MIGYTALGFLFFLPRRCGGEKAGCDLVEERLHRLLLLAALSMSVVVFAIASLAADFSNFTLNHAYDVVIHEQLAATAVVINKVSKLQFI